MKKMKKFLAMLLAMTMVLGMSLTAFAEDYSADLTIDAPKAGQTVWVSIDGINEKKEVTIAAYQIIEAKFDPDTGHFLGYKWVDEYNNGADIELVEDDETTDIDESKINNMTNIKGLTSEKITEWAKDPKGIPVTEKEWVATSDQYKMKLTAGTWMILVTSSDAEHVYNPMVVSAYYTHQDTIHGGTVEVNGQWKLVSDGAYVKFTDLSTGTSDKKVVTLNPETNKYEEADASQKVGENLTYQLTGIIPSYSAQYTDVKYVLMDTKNSGLKYNDDIVVKVGGTEVKKGSGENDAYTVSWYKSYTDETKNEVATGAAEANVFRISFNESYLRGIAGSTNREVEVIYTAQITGDAVTEVAENTFALDYTRNPGEDGNSQPPAEVEKIYSHTATIKGTVLKVNEKKEALPGAEFTLYETYEDGKLSDVFSTKLDTGEKKAGVQETGNDGFVNFAGLEFGKDYYMQETGAPEGYSINSTIYKVRCEYPKDFEAKGEAKLEKYTVTITNMNDSKAEPKVIEVNYGGSATILTGHEEIINTSLISLPSTGGIGTTIFTIGGCAIMIIAAGLYFSLRRKAAK